MRRLGRTVVLLLTLGVLYSGPVAACVCADDLMPAMPCCPDQPDFGHSGLGLLDSHVTACNPAPANLLPAASPELPAAIAISSAAPPGWPTHGPPPILVPADPGPHISPPIYLVTLRLRN